jgi:hypothetical protein
MGKHLGQTLKCNVILILFNDVVFIMMWDLLKKGEYTPKYTAKYIP